MSLLALSGTNSVSGGYEVANSVKFDKGNDSTTVEFFERNVSSAGNRDVGTFSAWIKKTDVTTAQYLFTFGNTDNDTGRTFARFQTDGTLRIGGGTTVWRNTDRVFRDTSAFYHIVIAFDTTQSTANDRIKVYVNGIQETSFGTTNNPSQNDDLGLNFQKQAIGYNTIDNNSGFNGYMAEVLIQDGTASAPTEFGEFDSNTGIWIPKDLSNISVGTNGTYLKFENAGSMGAATSGNAFTVQNINQNDQSIDTPTNNFCTWSPLWAFYRNSTITQGGTVVAGAAGGWSHAGASMGVTNGRWYWEWKITSSEIGFISFSTLEGNLNLNQLGHDNSVVMGYAGGNLYTWLNGSQGSNESTGWGTWAVNDIIGIYLDLENSDRRFTLYKNGSAISGSTSFPVSFPNAMQAANGAGNIFPYNVQYENDGGEWNFGGYTTMSNSKSNSDANGHGSFVYSPVLSGVNYYALCTKNLAEYG